MHGRLRHTLLGHWSAVVSRHPWWVLITSIVLALGCGLYAVSALEFQSNRNDLISQDLEWNQRFLRWRSAFPGMADLYIVVDTYNQRGEPDKQTAGRAEQLVDELGPRLEKHPAVKRAVWGYDAGAKGVNPRAVRIRDIKAFRQTLDTISQASALLSNATPGGFVQAVVQQFTRNATGSGTKSEDEGQSTRPAQALDRFVGLVRGFNKRFETPASQRVNLSEFTGGLAQSGWNYLRTENERLLVIRLTPREQAGALSTYGQSIQSIRQTLDGFDQRYPDLEFGLTGIEAVEADETAAAVRGSTLASILAVVLIAVLLIAAFHSLRVPLMLLLTLAVAIGWTFGFLTLVIGHLQVISVVFTVILLGLGVAFGIHLISRYEMVRHKYDDTDIGFAAALRDTLEVMGPGLLTGAVTTSVAFCTTLLTDFRGVAEMGAIAAAGIMLCLLAMVSLFPALLRLFKRGHHQMVRIEHRYFHFFEESWVMPFVRHPRWTVVVCMVVGLAAAIYGLGINFNYNLLALLPPHAPSVVWQKRLVERGEASVYQGVSVADNMDQARQLVRQFKNLDTVESVGGVGLLMPTNESGKLALIKKTRRELEPALSQAMDDQSTDASDQPAEAGAQPDDAGPQTTRPVLNQLAALQGLLGMFRGQAPERLQAKIGTLTDSISQTLASAQALPADKRQARTQALQRDYSRWRGQTARQISKVLDTAPLQLSDLPAPVIHPYMGHGTEPSPGGQSESNSAEGSNNRPLMLQINPKVPKKIGDPLDPQFLGRFVHDLESVDPDVTGVMVQIYYSSRLIQRAYVMAAIYALIAVLAIVWLDFRSLTDALLCLLPVAIGFACTFALLRLMNMAINPANIIVLPLMFGIGVDYGVHMLHRYRQNPSGQPPGLTEGTGKGIALTSYTTIIGFASLIVADHRGISSLGLTLALGISMTLLACWTLMPARLTLRRHGKEKGQETA